MKAWVLGGGKQEVGGSYLIGPVILGETGAQGELPERADGKADTAGGAWEESQVSSVLPWAWDREARRNILSSTTGMGLRGCGSHFISAQDERSPKPQK